MLRVSGLQVRTLACAGLAALALAGCGQQDGGDTAEEQPRPESSSSPASEAAPAGTPDCAEVWQEGEASRGLPGVRRRGGRLRQA